MLEEEMICFILNFKGYNELQLNESDNNERKSIARNANEKNIRQNLSKGFGKELLEDFEDPNGDEDELYFIYKEIFKMLIKLQKFKRDPKSKKTSAMNA
ncbi:hypothetical protein VNO77_30568 [Canavalia gladiata]|uniref:Uncharacterized protein n=1 Tax=Canavalia gladiata TaxID=3824 RepID=A0AAN9Q4B2_CANGL